MKSYWIFFVTLLLLAPAALSSVDDETCLDCHSDGTLEKEAGGKTISLFVDKNSLLRSVHKDLECVMCHEDADVDELPHAETLRKVQCAGCHDDVQVEFDSGIHGQALRRNEAYAPRCTDCHGKHDIIALRDPASRTYKMNIPYLCGGCHREGAPVARAYDISEHNIIENYSQSIHGEGMFKKGLLVTATCTDCHRSHKILPHTDPNSSISSRNISATCMRCHLRIEQVHVQVIRGELWESEPGAIPACTDCHRPHKVRKESVALIISDRDCLKCHEKPDVFKITGTDTLSMTVSRTELSNSVHANIPCVKCHSDIDPRLHRPCQPAGRADCSNCHAKVSEEYYESGHGRTFLQDVAQAPYCTTCHGAHGVISHRDDRSPAYRAAVPGLCGGCHREGGKASEVADLAETHPLSDYSTSVHGRGLTEKGLLPSAICIDCHNSHLILKHQDPRSSVNEKNIPATCATCHRGIYKQFIKSVHYPTEESPEEHYPTCKSCHSSHTIEEVEKDQFMTEVTHQCGSCHERLSETYLETMHGKAYQLGYLQAAKCSDCHSAHMILAVDDPNSTVGFKNILETCRKCHDDAGQRFTGYLTHATHHDPSKYPTLYYTYWAMTSLLVGVFSFFGLHTLLWLPRSFKQMMQRRKRGKHTESRYFIRRFTPVQRLTHLFVIISFISLAMTGMMLKFSGMPWAEFIAGLLGGVRAAGIIHRVAAVITFGYFLFHVTTLYLYKRRRRLTWLGLIFGKNSLMFNKKDVRDFIGTMKWFFGRGPRPSYGRWTYWEKFDYLAVFWGVAIIGMSGLMLWFPEFFTKFLPGKLINVATIVHSDEALLAVGFIFTIHFFNTHLRPEAFPMDPVIFTGTVPVDEYKNDRPLEYEEMKLSGELRKRVFTRKISKRRERAVYVFGYTALSFGILIIGLIIYSVLFGYH